MKQSLAGWIPVCLGLLALAGPGAAAWAQETQNTDRKIAPQDVLTIIIVGEKDLPVDFPVSASGTILFPFLETMEVKDKTPAEVAAMLKEALGKDYFVDPQVHVSVKLYRKEFVRVIGQVTRAGLVELPSEQRFDLLDALAAAGGLTNLANKNKISITRKGKTETYSLNQLKDIKDQAKRVWVEPDDLVEVPQTVF
jgi:polysaccharide export outer membrane protein